VTRASPSRSVTPKGRGGRTTVIVASAMLAMKAQRRVEIEVGDAVGVGGTEGPAEARGDHGEAPSGGVFRPVSTQRTRTPAGACAAAKADTCSPR
jgi:hypothetical protein